LADRFQSGGVAAAFTVQVTLAVLLGGLISALPDRPVNAVVAVLFAVGAVLLWRSADEEHEVSEVGAATSFFGISIRSFGLIFVAEFGDLTQITTAGMAARTGQPLAVAVGALAALWLVAAFAALAGQQLLRYLPLRLVRRIAAGIFAILALWTASEAFFV
jgi:putative Ca2+/H+ antiporter (TMEM165/GDT1 family)